MLSIKVALLSRTTQVTLPELAHVANALSIQVAHDFQPIWGVAATVEALGDPHHVPPGYWPIFVVEQLPPGEGGFHWTRHKQPFAEVEAGNSWSLSASHELIEMLVDPSGNRLVAGPALTVTDGQIGEDHSTRVEYLVEACDPCEAPDYAYLIEDVVVSDFFTPHFHDPVATAGTRYSFTGALTKPRQVLPEGYISWTDPESGDLLQLKYPPNGPEIVNLSEQQGALGTLSLREFVNRGEAKTRSPGDLSRLQDTHPLAKRRAERRQALAQAAAAKGRAYLR